MSEAMLRASEVLYYLCFTTSPEVGAVIIILMRSRETEAQRGYAERSRTMSGSRGKANI